MSYRSPLVLLACASLLAGCLSGGNSAQRGDSTAVQSDAAAARTGAPDAATDPARVEPASIVLSIQGDAPQSSPALMERTEAAQKRITDSPYEREPAIANCDAGVLKASEKIAALSALNAMRTAHGLGPVNYDANGDVLTRQAALMSAANRALAHTPAAGSYCFSAEGVAGAAQSNLYLRWSSSTSYPSTASGMASLLVDDGVPSLGHRRWMLHPFLGTTSFGRVDGTPRGTTTYFTAMSLRVMGGPSVDPTGTPAAQAGFVASPIGLEFPAAWFRHGWFMSFSVIANATNPWMNGPGQVNFANAQVQVTDPSGTVLAVQDRVADHSGFGLANVLQWRVAGTQNNVRYQVRIANVMVNGASRDYQYEFRIVP